MSLNPHPNWPANLELILAKETCVLVTLNLIMGSSPRESGSRMMVTRDNISGSIGGGNLEYTAICKARELLTESGQARQLHQPFGLGPALNQCCGGAVRVHFEVIPQGCPGWLEVLCSSQSNHMPAVILTPVDQDQPEHFVLAGQGQELAGVPEAVNSAALEWLRSEKETQSGTGAKCQAVVETEQGEWWLDLVKDDRPALFLFGAGHVGQAVAKLLHPLPFRLTWVDERSNIFPDDAATYCRLLNSDPIKVVADAEANTIFVVMTHSHELDEDICHAVLTRKDFRWLGLIGSSTKRRRFVHRLEQRGITEELLQRLVCPIGLAGIEGKQPATIALSLAAQLMMESTWTAESN
jgi:xanthine dehydrogenase accessory factor